jgi:hypothetical protein
MKKIKIILNAIAITAAITGAFATHYCTQANFPQYIPANDTFQPVGDFGIDYKCYASKNICTYYQPDSIARPEEFLPYRKGQFAPIGQ